MGSLFGVEEWRFMSERRYRHTILPSNCDHSDEMPIYLAEEISGNLKPTLLLEERGLKMRSVSVSRLDPQAFPYMLQPVYRTYVNSISAFLVSLSYASRAVLTVVGCNNIQKEDPYHCITAENLCRCKLPVSTSSPKYCRFLWKTTIFGRGASNPSTWRDRHTRKEGFGVQ
jgi:hypothetical protein